jgi:hypothetical protein
MKNTLVPTTAARGTAVNRSRITAVQSVYIGCGQRIKTSFQQVSCALTAGAMDWGSCRGRAMPQPASSVHGPRPGGFESRLFGAALLGLLLAAASPLQAGVRFENCVTGADGAITCDTVPTGSTLANDEAARFGLFANASPGWNEFDPYAGYEDDFGGNRS